MPSMGAVAIVLLPACVASLDEALAKLRTGILVDDPPSAVTAAATTAAAVAAAPARRSWNPRQKAWFGLGVAMALA